MAAHAAALALIPARGGSKGIPGKNLQEVGGLPLVVRSIHAAQASDRVTRVVVSTDDEAIAELSRDAGADVVHARRALRGIAPVLNRLCCMPSMPWHVQVNPQMDSRPIWCFCSAHHRSPLAPRSTRFSQPSTNRRSTAALPLLPGMASFGELMGKALTMTRMHHDNAAKISIPVI